MSARLLGFEGVGLGIARCSSLLSAAAAFAGEKGQPGEVLRFVVWDLDFTVRGLVGVL